MSFDRLAPFYHAMERVAAGNKMQRCRTAFLGEIPAPRRALLAGEGPGRFLTEFSRRFPDTEITVADSSAKMLEIAATRASSGHIRFVRADLSECVPEGSFDLIVTHFFLDCFPPEQLAKVISNLAGCATLDATWLLADFQIAPGSAAGLRSRVILALLYRFFRTVCGLRARSLAPPEACLESAGFRLRRRVTHDWHLMKSEWWRRG